VSVEPMLEEIDLWSANYKNPSGGITGAITAWGGGVDWIIIGGESGSKARPFHVEWARSLIDQCREAGTAVFMKQAGSNAFYEGKPFKTKSRAGSDPSEWPEWARVQEFPQNANGV